jgi:hypothetical protein
MRADLSIERGVSHGLATFAPGICVAHHGFGSVRRCSVEASLARAPPAARTDTVDDLPAGVRTTWPYPNALFGRRALARRRRPLFFAAAERTTRGARSLAHELLRPPARAPPTRGQRRRSMDRKMSVLRGPGDKVYGRELDLAELENVVGGVTEHPVVHPHGPPPGIHGTNRGRSEGAPVDQPLGVGGLLRRLFR